MESDSRETSQYSKVNTTYVMIANNRLLLLYRKTYPIECGSSEFTTFEYERESKHRPVLKKSACVSRVAYEMDAKISRWLLNLIIILITDARTW